MIHKYLQFLKKNKSTLILLLIIFLTAVFFRFYNYDNRWGLASDQARDAIVVTQALATHSIPIIGPFSASGPFVFGPYMYWFMMFSGIIFPFGFIKYWVALGLLSTLTTFLMMAVGYETENKYLGLLAGLFVAVSPIQIGISTNLVASSLAGALSVAAVYFFVRTIKYAKTLDIFLLSLFVGFAVNTHFQTVPLMILLPVSYISGKLKIKNLLPLAAGLFIPFIPLLIFDLNANFYESNHIMTYFFNSGYPPDITKRWIIYLTSSLPSLYALILGGNFITGFFIMVSTSAAVIYFFIKRNINKIILALGIVLALIIVILRYFPGQLFGNFIAFLIPFIIILFSWLCLRLFKLNKFLGIIIILIIFISTAFTSYGNIALATNYSSSNAKMLANELEQQFPKGTKFSIYDYGYENTQISLPLVLYLSQDGKISDNGIRIGIAGSLIPNVQLNYFEKGRYTEFIYTLRNFSNDELVKNGWVSVNPSNVYKSVENWYK